MSQTYTVKQVAEMLGYSTNSIYAFIKEKRIKGVRVGKGRFRISQEELDRVMHLSKLRTSLSTPSMRKNPTEVLSTQTAGLTSNHEPVASREIPEVFYTFQSMHFSMPCLFDWFVGVNSIILGFSMFLFNKYFDTSDISRFQSWLWPLQVTFIIAGFGVLLNAMIKGATSVWHKIFHITLLLVYGIFALIRWQVGDGGGFLLYAIIGAMIIINLILDKDGVWKFVATVITYAFAIPILLFFKPDFVNLPEQLQFVRSQPQLYIPLWLLLVFSYALSLWLTYSRRKLSFWLLTIGGAMLLFLLSFWFANSLAWGKSVTTLMMAIVMLIIPFWITITSITMKDRLVIFGMFVGITLILSTSLTALWLMERNVKEYAGKEMLQKVQYGEFFLESTLASVQKTTEEAVKSKLLVNALNKEDRDELTRILRLTHEGNDFIKTLEVLDPQGNLLTIYPYTNESTASFTTRDYFRQAIKTQDTFVGYGFKRTDEDINPDMTVAVPVIGHDGEIKGVLVTTVDFDTLGTRLQKIATPEKGEYFVVVDQNGKRIIHPDGSLIGGKVTTINEGMVKSESEYGINEGYSNEGIRVLVAFNKDETRNWIVGLHAPIAKVLTPTHSANLLIFGGITLTVLTMAVFLLVIRARKWKELARF